MKSVQSYLSLGSNLGDRRANLESAIARLESRGVRVAAVSPVFRTPALLLPGSPLSWNMPYFNCAIKIETELSPDGLLRAAKAVESEMGRDFSLRWAPRPIDIDILTFGGLRVESETLRIPHLEKYFDRDAVSWIGGGAPEYGGKHLPVFMGIINATPDSFSGDGTDGDCEKFAAAFERFEQELVGIADIGAESTRPDAAPLTPQEELKRLAPVFDFLRGYKFRRLRPLLSIDTYHYETARAAIENGFDIINDVGALSDERMLDILADAKHARYVLTHSLSVPPKKDLIVDGDPVAALKKFLDAKMELFAKRGVAPERIFFDPGLGFGKDPYQSFAILNALKEFQNYGVRILVGHSRKSFLNALNESTATRDADTLALSMKLAPFADVLRVHTPVEHQNALLAYGSIDN
jgi:2-amino-4-hydroxy-6-hydroxymethyldihydropteridine diphosphokinase/dihydropteroate synthase